MPRPIAMRETLRHATAYVMALSAMFATVSVPARRCIAQPSLAAEDMITELAADVNGVSQRFTVMRDALQKDQWYYVPAAPRLYERAGLDGRPEPEFALIRYQFQDPSNREALDEGGVLQFAMTLGIPPDAVEALRRGIASMRGVDPKTLRLAAIPFKSAEVHLYLPDSLGLVASAPQGPGIAPMFSTQKVVFSVPLTRKGADVYDALAKGSTGLLAGIDFKYTGYTPPLGFDVTVDWDQAYEHYSKDQSFRAKAAYTGYFGAEVNIDKTKIYEELEKRKVISVNTLTGEGFTATDAYKYIDAFLNRINEELLQDMKPPATVTPAKADSVRVGRSGFWESLKGNWGVSGGYSVAVKDVRYVKKGKETIKFQGRMVQERQTSASGGLSIGAYPKDIQERLVTVVPPGPWKSAYFILPSVGDAQSLGIQQVDLLIRLTKDGKQYDTQAVSWTSAGGWRGTGRAPRTVLAFGLMNLRQGNGTLDGVRFESEAQITHGNNVLRVSEKMPVDDERALVTPLSLAKVVHLDGSSLTWNRVDPLSPLDNVLVTLKTSAGTFTDRLKARNADGTWLPPQAKHWLVPRNTESIVADIAFRLKDGTTLQWKRNGENLASGQESSGDLFVDLIDADWRE